MEHPSLILVVDDQPSSQLVLGGLLDPEGYRIAFAANGLEALTKMRQLVPDLVLLDVMMPDMDGFEVCRHIRADPDLALIPVIMLTALDDQASLLQGLEAGADDFISKPFSRVELRTRIRTITRLNRSRLLLEQQRRTANKDAQLRWAIERSADGYLFLDADERPRDGNARGWFYLGCEQPADDATPEAFLTLVHRQYRLEPAELWTLWPESGPAPRYLVGREVSETLWLQVAALELPDGGPYRWMVHLHDVTTQIVAQRNVWAFHSFVSHKLRTPLTSLVTGMGLVRRFADQLEAEHKALFGIAYDGAQNLKHVVDDIFRYLEAPLGFDRSSSAQLDQLEAMVVALGAELGLKRLEVVADLGAEPGALPLSMRTCELLLTELLENAQKFHPLKHPHIVVSLQRHVEHVTLSVLDDGVTLSQAQLHQIWAPYQQLDPDFTGQVAGLGLGLATVAQICWAVGGRCRITNRSDGPGLWIELSLPLTEMME